MSHLQIEHNKRSTYAPEQSSLNVGDATTDEGLRERPLVLTQYEASYLAEHWLREIVEIDRWSELMQLSGSSDHRLQAYYETRLNALIAAGLLTFEEVKS